LVHNTTNKNSIKKEWFSQAPVAHTCNPSYSGGRDQEDHSSSQPQANSSWDPISKNPTTKKKKAGGVAQGVGPELKPQYHKKIKWKKEKNTFIQHNYQI
jgi:hypothetical protein